MLLRVIVYEEHINTCKKNKYFCQ